MRKVLGPLRRQLTGLLVQSKYQNIEKGGTSVTRTSLAAAGLGVSQTFNYITIYARVYRGDSEKDKIASEPYLCGRKPERQQ